MSPIEIISLLGALLAILNSLRVSYQSARKDEVATLREVIAEMRTQVACSTKENDNLHERVNVLSASDLQHRAEIEACREEYRKLQAVNLELTKEVKTLTAQLEVSKAKGDSNDIRG